MSPIENVQHSSSTGRRTLDVALLAFVASVATAIGLGAAGVM